MWLYVGQDFYCKIIKSEVQISIILPYVPNIELQIYKAIKNM